MKILEDDVIDPTSNKYWKCERHNIDGMGKRWCFVCKNEDKERSTREYFDKLDKNK